MLSFPLLCEIIANTDLPKAPEHKTGRHIMECPKIQINDIRPLRKTTEAFFWKAQYVVFNYIWPMCNITLLIALVYGCRQCLVSHSQSSLSPVITTQFSTSLYFICQLFFQRTSTGSSKKKDFEYFASNHTCLWCHLS